MVLFVFSCFAIFVFRFFSSSIAWFYSLSPTHLLFFSSFFLLPFFILRNFVFFVFFFFSHRLVLFRLSRRRAVGPHRYARLFLGSTDGNFDHGSGGDGTAGDGEGEEDEGQTAEHASLMFLTALR